MDLAHIIDLKKKSLESKPKGGSFFNDYKPPVITSPPDQDTIQVTTPTPKTPEQRELITEKLPTDTTIISWSSRFHELPDKYAATVIAIIFFGIAVIVQVFEKNLITTVFFAMLGAVVLLNANRKPSTGFFEINPTGIVIGKTTHRFGDIKSFWIEYDPTLQIRELSLQLKKWYMPYLKMPIDDQNPTRIRSILLEFLPEIEHKDTLVEVLARRLGF